MARTKSEADLQADVFKALAHRARIDIINLLAVQDLTLHELCRTAEIGASTVCRHALLLKRAGIIQERRAGPYIHYSLIARDLLPAIKIAAGVRKKHLAHQASLIKST